MLLFDCQIYLFGSACSSIKVQEYFWHSFYEIINSHVIHTFLWIFVYKAFQIQIFWHCLSMCRWKNYPYMFPSIRGTLASQRNQLTRWLTSSLLDLRYTIASYMKVKINNKYSNSTKQQIPTNDKTVWTTKEIINLPWMKVN